MKNLIFTFLFLPVVAFSQRGLKLVSATSQRWSGGIPGNVGTNYSLDFVFSLKDSISIDSIYINNVAYATVNSNSASSNAYWFKNNKNHISLIVHESMVQCTYPVDGDTSKKQQKPTINMDGAALVVYHYKHKKKKLLVKSFVALPPLHYP
ncbi:MAG: hypothetical protein NT150_14960 [Bacteroidetes bacterium]|nr:hypothetical protein [Bacteroidota bacterium]